MTLPIAILAGGLGTRLYPVTQTVPKALIPVAGRPFIAYQLELLKRQGIEKVVLCVGHLGEMIEAELGAGRDFGIEVCYSFDGPKLLGTGGAIAKALPFLGERFFVMYGDSYLPIDYRAVEKRYVKAGREGLMTVFENHGKWDTSNVWYEAGEIRRYDKKNRVPEMRCIDYGLSIFSAEVFRNLPPDEVVDLAEIMQGLLARKQLTGYLVEQRFYEVGSPEGLREFEQLMLASQAGITSISNS